MPVFLPFSPVLANAPESRADREQAAAGSHAPTPEPSLDGCPGPCHSGYIFSQLLVSLHVRCLLAQVHQKGMPAHVTPRHSKRETSRELDLHPKPSAGAEKTRQWARPWSPFLRQM